MWQLNIVYMRLDMEGGMGKLSVDYYGKRRGKVNAGILYKCDANTQVNTRQALAEPIIIEEMENVLLSYPCSSPCILYV